MRALGLDNGAVTTRGGGGGGPGGGFGNRDTAADHRGFLISGNDNRRQPIAALCEDLSANQMLDR